MTRIEEWERDLLGNLAGSVKIYPEERNQMNALSSWLVKKPREWEIDTRDQVCGVGRGRRSRCDRSRRWTAESQ